MTEIADKNEYKSKDGKTSYNFRVVTFVDKTMSEHSVVFTGYAVHYINDLKVGKVSRVKDT